MPYFTSTYKEICNPVFNAILSTKAESNEIVEVFLFVSIKKSVGFLRIFFFFSWTVSKITSQFLSNWHVIWQLLKASEKLFFRSGH